MRVLLRQALRTFRGDESGQSLIVIVSAMTVLLVIAAFAIDTANWMVRHHDAQVVADSAALAAAQCLANPNQPASIEVNGTTQTLTPCGSSDTQTAQQNARKVAEAYAAANGVSISDSDVSFSGKVVTVKASTSTPTVFARVTGIGSASQTAQAGAGWTAGTGQCSDPTAAESTCDFMFANDSACSVGTNGINLSMAGNASETGIIQSNANLTIYDQDNGTSLDGASYGPGCSYTLTKKNPTWQTTPTEETSVAPYPVDYSKDFPACGGSGDPCQANGYPSFCTNVSSQQILYLDGSGSGDTVQQDQIYCASGTGSPSDPSTWNGGIVVALGPGTPLYASFVGGWITYDGKKGNTELSACGYASDGYTGSNCTSSVPKPVTNNYPLFYATCQTSACTVPSGDCNSNCVASTVLEVQGEGNFALNGDMYAPGGTMCIPKINGTPTLLTMIEAEDIDAYLSGTMNGDGPSAGGTSGSGGGSISLVQ